MYKYVYVPVELCFFAFRNRYVRQLQLFVYLKSICDGHLTIDSREQERIAKELGLKSSRAIRNNLKDLIMRNWIGYNRQSKRYYLRSYNTIHSMENFTSYTRAEYNIAEIRQFKAFAAGAVMCKLINKQRSKKWREAREKGRAIQSRHTYYPIALSALAKILCISNTTSFKLRGLAVDCRYVLMRKGSDDTGVKQKEYFAYLKAMPEFKGRTYIKDGKVLEHKPDLFFPCIRFVRGKKRKDI